MDVERLRRARFQKPFSPFTIRLRDGRSLPVSRPDAIAMSDTIVVVIGADGYGTSHIGLEHITAIEFQTPD